MTSFSREELVEACAALYRAAQKSFMLPPLIRGASNFGSEASVTHDCPAGDFRLKFTVDFDADYVERHKFPLERLPLGFRTQLCDRDGNDLPIRIDERETRILTYAFLLGAKAPIQLEEDDEPPFFRVALQLSPTFFLRWRLEFANIADATAEDICRLVASSLYERSRDLFICEADGVAIWSARAAEELFGAEQPSTEALWNSVAAAPRLAPPGESPGRGQGATAPAVAPAAAPPAVAAARRDPPAFRSWRKPQFAALAAVAVIAIVCWESRARVLNAEPAVDLAPTAAAVPQQAGLEPEAASTLREASLVPDAAHPLNLEPMEAPPSSAEPPLLDEPAAADSPAPASSAAAPEQSQAPVKLAARRQKAAAAKLVAHAAKSGKPKAQHAGAEESNPLATVGRAITHFATGVAKGLQSIPRRLSTL